MPALKVLDKIGLQRFAQRITQRFTPIAYNLSHLTKTLQRSKCIANMTCSIENISTNYFDFIAFTSYKINGKLFFNADIYFWTDTTLEKWNIAQNYTYNLCTFQNGVLPNITADLELVVTTNATDFGRDVKFWLNSDMLRMANKNTLYSKTIKAGTIITLKGII